jgi:hypothetical protein
MKALFIGGALHNMVVDVPSVTPKYRHYRKGEGSGGDQVYLSQSLTQKSTGKRWLIYTRKGALPASDVIAGMIQAHALPTIEEQRNGD